MRTHRKPFVLVPTMALALMACTSTADPEAVASLEEAPDRAPETAAPDPDDAFLAYTACMREEGIPMDDPGVGGSFEISASVGADEDGTGGSVNINGEEIDYEAYEAASEACESLLDDVVTATQADPAAEAAMQDQVLAFAACMRERGFDWPDPAFDGSMAVAPDDDGSTGDPVDIDDPAAQAAMADCSDGGVVIGDGSSVATDPASQDRAGDEG